MSIQATRTARFIAASLAVALVASCGTIPRSGPTKNEIFAGAIENEGNAFVIPVDARVTTATAVGPTLGFSESFRNAGLMGTDTIRPGDTLSLIVYENVTDGLLTNVGASASQINQVQVDASGFIFIPYAGRIQAAGNTPEALRRTITARLDEQTPDPQVVVQRLAGDGATVAVVGTAGAQGVYPIERPTRTLTGMIARAGGVAAEPEITTVTVTRNGRSEGAYLSDLYKQPALDIALRDGDTVFLEADTRTFTVLGATGAQNRLSFETETISAIEALAQVGGLNPNYANPTGVFILRDEHERIARQVIGRPDLQGPQRMIYVLDLTEPNGMFEARDFVIRDGDTVYVTEAPIVRWNRTIAALFGSLNPIVSSARTVGVN
ncbi:polysaccharide export protein Wza [Jannaschia seosinensis]|uniref:Polysaccharide export protein Wza n=1 Tax=Jannaschia seosinensis TaxID=313367 RepID=A0A0M7BA64_9RHOB|nr:polysaccharide biosynthesis/export family protein [Jannaschia seosinensis]CUH38481.1 polysaccharide export protein Wza [Jannaschia seosinensis]